MPRPVLLFVLCAALGACGSGARSETVPRDAACLHAADCPGEAACVTNRCLVPCESGDLCVGCDDPRDCTAGADQFCDQKRAEAGEPPTVRPFVSREEFCADCHRE